MDAISLVPGVFFLRFPIGHAYLVEDDDGLTLVDTSVPGSAPLIADVIRGLGHDLGDMRRLVLTHFHVDHVGSAAEIAEWGQVIVHAHRAEVPVIHGDAAEPPPQLTDWERPLLEQIRSQMPSFAPTARVHVDHELEDGDILDFGGGAHVVAAPGHTPGSLAIHLPERGVLFTGDAVARRNEGQVILGVFNCDPLQAAESFQRLAALDAEVACFGHGEPVTHAAATELRAAAQHLS